MQQDYPLNVTTRQNRWPVDVGTIVLFSIVTTKLLIHLYASRNYGYFIDELYYIACSDHLDWGYVDQPPMVALITKIARSLLGDSLQAIRFFSALAGAAKVLLAAMIARELGGNRFAQILAALAVLVAPGFLAIDNLLSMNSFEALIWTACAYVLIRIVKTGNQRLWIWFGLLAGIGLENKHSMLIWGAAISAGLLLTPQRRWFRTRWIWIAGLLAFLIFLPNLVWNYQHHFPFLELQANIRRSGRNVELTPLSFFGQEILSMHPMTLPIWLAGLWFYLFSKTGKSFRPIGLAWLFYNGLSADIRAKTAILAQNYGQAGAIDLFGLKFGLPKAISGHQNYFFWGPRDFTGESVIVLQGRQDRLEDRFASVTRVANVYHPYSMPSEHFDVFYCRGPKRPLKEVWPELKSWN